MKKLSVELEGNADDLTQSDFLSELRELLRRFGCDPGVVTVHYGDRHNTLVRKVLGEGEQK